jgi:hypothetical protein
VYSRTLLVTRKRYSRNSATAIPKGSPARDDLDRSVTGAAGHVLVKVGIFQVATSVVRRK